MVLGLTGERAQEKDVKDDRILSVDDDLDNELLLHLRVLKKGGISNAIVVARDVAEVVDRLLDTDRLLSLLILNVRLHTVNGPEVVTRLREQHRIRHLPIVLPTSCEARQRGTLVEIVGQSADLCLSKGVNLERFQRDGPRLKSVVLGEILPSAQEGCAPDRSSDEFLSRCTCRPRPERSVGRGANV